MGKTEFILTSKSPPERLLEYILDFEYYTTYFPIQIKDVKIIKHENNEIITEEKIVFSTLVKNVIKQKSLHKKISDKELITEIIDGPAKGTIVNISCKQIESGSEISFIIDLKLSLKAKFLQRLIKKFYKRYLTALILKINAREVDKQIK